MGCGASMASVAARGLEPTFQHEHQRQLEQKRKQQEDEEDEEERLRLARIAALRAKKQQEREELGSAAEAQQTKRVWKPLPDNAVSLVDDEHAGPDLFALASAVTNTVNQIAKQTGLEDSKIVDTAVKAHAAILESATKAEEKDKERKAVMFSQQAAAAKIGQAAYATYSHKNASIGSGSVGISLQFVLELLHKEVPIAAGWDTNAISKHIVEPRTRLDKVPGYTGPKDPMGCRYVDIIPEAYVSSPPTFFFSHTWDGTLMDQLDTVVKYCKAQGIPPSMCFLWIDVFVLKQNDPDVAKNSSEFMKGGIETAQRTLLYIDHRAAAVTRVWCLYEVWQSMRARGQSAIHIATINEPRKMVQCFLKIDVQNAQATKAEDVPLVLGWIRESGISFEDINKTLQELFVEIIHKMR